MKAHSHHTNSESTHDSHTHKSSGVSEVAKSLGIQTALKIGAPDDKYETEAENVADKVMAMSDPTVQRKCDACAGEESEGIQPKRIQMMGAGMEEEEIAPKRIQKMEMEDEETVAPKRIQMMGEEMDEEAIAPKRIQKMEEEMEEAVAPKLQLSKIQASRFSPEGNASSSLESTLNSSKGGGAPLNDDTKSFMEDRIGADFSNVKVHTDSTAVQMNQELGAQAFAHGSDVYFNQGKFDPGSHSGKHLLAHELTHVVQQGGASLQAKSIRKKESEKKPFGMSL